MNCLLMPYPIRYKALLPPFRQDSYGVINHEFRATWYHFSNEMDFIARTIGFSVNSGVSLSSICL